MTLSQAVKANLVERVCQWPGVHSAGALIDGTPLTGHWFDRTQEFLARLRHEDIGRMRFAAVETVTFCPSPAGPICRRSSTERVSPLRSRPSRPTPPGKESAAVPSWVESRRFCPALRYTARPP